LPPDITVRNYRETDRPQVVGFRCYDYGRKWTKAAQRIIRDAPETIVDSATPADAKIAVAVDQTERIVGVAVYGVRADGVREIFSLGVIKDRRREKIGTGLKLAVLAEFAASGGRQDVFSSVHRRNDAMLGLNDKIGVEREKDPDNGEYWISAIAVEPEDAA
jgi:ribosomal protein S18 acetylase RimI-like enzyme